MIATSGGFAVRASGASRLRAVLAADRRELLALLPALEEVRPEDVHRARVLARRMRAVLRAYAPAFGKARARRARRLLKAFARTLDDCREIDVLEALVRDAAAEANGASRRMRAELFELLERARLDARRMVVQRFGRPGSARQLHDALAGLGVEGGVRVGWMLEQLDRSARRVRRRIRRDHGAEGLHRLRLAVKSLRYVLAPFEGVAPVAGRRLHTRLRVAQDRLGEQHDLAQALSWAEAAPQRRVVDRPLRRALRERERASRRAAREAVKRLDPAWSRWRIAAGEVTAAPSDRPGRG